MRYVAIDSKGRRVAVTSEYVYISKKMNSNFQFNRSELFVRVVDMEDTSKSTRLEGYKSGVRTATWHPSGSLLVRLFCLAVSALLIHNTLGYMYVRW